MAADILLYDGHCRFCIASARALETRTGAPLTLTSFRDVDVTAWGLTIDDCEKRIYLVMDDGRVVGGVTAVVQTLRRRWYGPLLKVLLLPGLLQISDAVYRLVSKYRFKLMGRKEPCADGSCSIYQ